MSTTTKVIVTLVTVVILAGIAILITGRGATQSDTQQQGAIPPLQDITTLTINYTDTGFAPAVATIEAGKPVKIMNQSKSVLSFASALHPTHDDNSELNLGDIKAGDSKTFTPTKKGTWGFHDHYNSANTGKLTVE